MTIRITPEECIPPIRPSDLVDNAPWPPEAPRYPLPHRIWTTETSDKPFNMDIAIKDFGTGCVQRVLERQHRFTGDAWFLCALKLVEEACRKSDEDCRHKYRYSWINNRVGRPQDPPLHLEGVIILGWDLRKVDLSNAIMRNCRISRSNLTHSRLWNCKLENSSIVDSDLSNADCFNAHLNYADLSSSNLDHANLKSARLFRTRFFGASLNGTNLQHTNGLLFDFNAIDRVNIEGNSKDPWTILRRTYTGPKYFVNLLLLVAFFIPFFSKALYLTAVSNTQSVLIELTKNLDANLHETSIAKDALIQSLSNFELSHEKVFAGSVLLGWTDGLLLSVLTGVVIFYNMTRAYLTSKISSLRDAEERSKISPSLGQYYGDFHPLSNVSFPFTPLRVFFTKDKRTMLRDPLARIGLYRLHQVAKMLYWVATIALVYNLLHWLLTTQVWVPK